MLRSISDWFKHFFHVVSNIRPIVWIALYIGLIPIFALIYWWMPDGQFRIPDGAGTDYGSWIYYSIVTITTLGFGDYTPAHGWAQAVTAIEVGCGLVFLGFFLNAVGSMKSEIDVKSEIEKQRRLHEAQEKDKLMKHLPMVLHKVNAFLEDCNALAGKDAKQLTDEEVNNLVRSAASTSLLLDNLQNRVDLALWPELLENCFGFVAQYQMFASGDPRPELPHYIAEAQRTASAIETALTALKAAKA